MINTVAATAFYSYIGLYGYPLRFYAAVLYITPWQRSLVSQAARVWEFMNTF